MKGESMTTAAVKKWLRSKEAERIFHERLIADAAISPEMEEMARAAARSAVVEYEDAGVRERTGPDWRNSRVLRRAVIVFIVAGFFILHPAYRTFAQEIWDFIVHITEHRVVLTQDSGIEVSFSGEPSSDVSYETPPEQVVPSVESYDNAISEFKRNTGVHSVACLTGDWLELIGVQQGSFGNNAFIAFSYTGTDGGQVSLSQCWYADPAGAAIVKSADDPTYFELPIRDTVMYCIIDEKDHIFSGTFADGQCLVTVMAEEEIVVEDLLSALDWK